MKFSWDVDQKKLFWEQKLSLSFNELGVSSYPHERQKLGTRRNCSPAGRFLHPLVAIQDAFEELLHKGLEVGVRRLGDHPVCIATQGPAGNRAHQGLLVTQTLDKVWDELWQVLHHTLHTAWTTRRHARKEEIQAHSWSPGCGLDCKLQCLCHLAHLDQKI